MSLLAVPILAVLAFFLVILSSFIFYIFFSRLQEQIQLLTKQVEANEQLVTELQLGTYNLNNNLTAIIKTNEQSNLENIQCSKQLEHRIQTLQQHFSDQQNLVSQLHENQGQNKFYSRAFRLAEKGASIDEIMCECDLPRAEVEMLLSVYQQRSQR